MPPPFTIEIGPEGFRGPGDKPRFKVKQNRSVVFNLVDGAAPVNVYFASGSPFGSDLVVPVGSSGSAELAFQDGAVGNTYSMQLQAPGAPDAGLEAMGGPAGDIEVDPYP